MRIQYVLHILGGSVMWIKNIVIATTIIFSANGVVAKDNFITVASTTSTENSGLFDYLLPIFTEATKVEVRVVAVGTGNAIKLAENGDADVLLVHHRASEEKFINEGYGVERLDLMYNDFVIVGPASDPAKIKGQADLSLAMKAINDGQVAYVSRGDNSGTYKKELELWEQAITNAPLAAENAWFKETGKGMGASLNMAADFNAYILTDRATWLNFNNKRDLIIVVENNPKLFNYYGIIMVSPEKHTHVKVEQAQAFVDWMVSEKGQQAINGYKIKGQQAFFANAEK